LPMFSCTSETCTRAEQGKPVGSQTKTPRICCEAFGAENETRIFVYNTNRINYLRKLMMKLGVK
ncbi:MAG: hypothetical protein IJQ93_07940, partial [Bacteroidales bacterium]|nr:hypothetical protein [Bacteroidales bacterium]